MNREFDDIRPYRQEEIPAAMKRIAASDKFPQLAAFVFPDREIEEVRRMVASLTTIEQFQHEVMNEFNHQVIRRSIDDFSFDGLELIDPHKAYLYVSNHRDIVLDSSLLQTVLHENQFPTTEITFGANLMQGQLVIDIGKSNKMFRVERGATPKEFYKLSMHLSEYIRQTLQEGRSVWIAQRNGRTKDGDDRTDQGIIKMFSMSGTTDQVLSLAELNLLPVSVSYEWEPCDFQKAIERYRKLETGSYQKQPGEDLRSILSGIEQYKGRVHFAISNPLTETDLEAFHNHTLNEYHQQVAHLMDQRIWSNYKLWPNNYIALDLLEGQDTHRDNYTEKEKQKFLQRIDQLKILAGLEIGTTLDWDKLLELFLQIYANPVRNVNSLKQKDS